MTTVNDHLLPLQLLLVEDNPGDVLLVREAIREYKIANQLHVVTDGEAAIDFVLRRGDYVDAPRPDLIFLDLNLPLCDGREVLRVIKGDDRTRAIPVVVMTSSQAEIDVAQSYKLQANSYVTKPLGFAQFVDVIRSIESFWLTMVRLPPRTEPS